jgi:hypothetical protein
MSLYPLNGHNSFVFWGISNLWPMQLFRMSSFARIFCFRRSRQHGKTGRMKSVISLGQFLMNGTHSVNELNHLKNESESESYITTDGQSASLAWNKAPIWGLTTRFLLVSDRYGFADVGRSLWREDGSVVYNLCWSSPAQWFLGPSPAGLVTIFCCLRFETFPFHRFLRLAGLQWRYSTPPPHGSWRLNFF